MNQDSVPWVLSFMSAVIGPAIGYIQGKRRASGKVQSSEASDLWEEGKDIRKFLMDEINSLKSDLRSVKKEFDEYKQESEGEIEVLKKENRELRNQLSALHYNREI